MVPMTRVLHSHCSYCGQPFAADGWPRPCAACGSISYCNPKPVTCLVQPVGDGGLLVVKRGIEPQLGRWCLPGGYLDHCESWRSAAARELFEEAGVRTDPDGLVLLDAVTDDRNFLIFIAQAPPVGPEALDGFVPNDEAPEIAVLREPAELAFPYHTLAARRFFSGFKFGVPSSKSDSEPRT